MFSNSKIRFRHIDDILAIVDETFNMDLFLEQTDSQYPSVKFTYEKEVEGKLPFLGLTN